MRGDRKCILDSKQYNYCPHCNHDNPNETWRYLFCSENCREIYKILEDWTGKKISSDDAKQKLVLHELPSLDQIQPSLRKNIEDINASAQTILTNRIVEEKPKRRGRKKKTIVNED